MFQENAYLFLLFTVISSQPVLPPPLTMSSQMVGTTPYLGFQWLSGKESACSAGDTGLIPGSGRSPGGRTDNPLQYSCQENPMDRGAWLATIHSVMKSWTLLK